MNESERCNVASFFSGAGGLDLGFKARGFNIVFANDSWSDACQTFKTNHSAVEVIKKPIEKLEHKDIKLAMKKQGVCKIDIIIGGPPCQCFTRLNNEFLLRNENDPRRDLFKYFIKKINQIKPRLVFMENVRDLMVRKNKEGITYDKDIINNFKKIGYYSTSFVLNAANFNVPQNRIRIIFVATNDKKIEEKIKDNADYFKKIEKKHPPVKHYLKKLEGKKNLSKNEITVNKPETLERIRHVPPGGYYEHLPDYLKTKKMRNGKKVIVKRYGSHYRRLDANKPSKTITTNYVIHPTKNRYLTNREKAILHTFPLRYEFHGASQSVTQQIANAVPPNLAKNIAKYARFLLS